MEYLVTMTTEVPDGTSEQSVEEVKAREVAHSAVLAAEGHLLRLWRPPLLPGEWRTFGLFAAADRAALEKVLASMPLRIWRTDQVSALEPHPNDPGTLERARHAVEFLVTMTIKVPDGTSARTVHDTETREAARARELSGQGHLARLWKLPAGTAERRALGLWSAGDAAAMQAILESLPLYDWMTVYTTQLQPHPSDPALAKS